MIECEQKFINCALCKKPILGQVIEVTFTMEETDTTTLPALVDKECYQIILNWEGVKVLDESAGLRESLL